MSRPRLLDLFCGAGTAAATYSANEQGMIQRMYDALRNYGWLT